MKRYFLSLFLPLLLCSCLEASVRLHSLIVGDTQSSDIREGTWRDCQSIQQSLKDIAHHLQIPHDETTLLEKKYTTDNIRKWISRIREDDIVFFYYSGHGFRPKKKSDPWPVLSCRRMVRKKSDFIFAKEICSAIKKKHPRLSLIFFDCCNDALKIKSPFNTSTYIPFTPPFPGLQTLFLNTKGMVTACAASPGQPALTCVAGGTIGSLFSISFLKALREEIGDSETQWEYVLERTIPKTFQDSNGRQRPFYKIRVTPIILDQ